jgi:hypothetical protein
MARFLFVLGVVRRRRCVRVEALRASLVSP